MTMKKCDICGGQIVEGSNFCGYCGVDFKDVEEETPVKEQVNVEKIFEASEEKKTNKELPRFTACQLKGIPIFYGLIGYIMLFRGEALLTFCGCGVCNQSYRDIYANLVNIAEKRKLSASSREIVRRVRAIDITTAEFDFSLLSRLFFEDKDPKEKKETLETIRHSTVKNGKIVIELDASQFEEQIFHVISSDRGKELIKHIVSE